MQPYLDFDNERCFDLIMIGGGIRPIPGTERWKRICFTFYRLLGFYQFIMSMAKAVFSILDKGDMVGLCSSFGTAVCLVAIFAKVCILEHNEEVFRQSKFFVNSNSIRIIGQMALAICVVGSCDQVFLVVPSSVRDRMFNIPKQFDMLGATTAGLMKIAFLSTLAFYWCNRYFYTSLKIIALLMGLRNDLTSVASAYSTLTEPGVAKIFNDTSNVLKLKHSKQMLRTAVAQHVDVLR